MRVALASSAALEQHDAAVVVKYVGEHVARLFVLDDSAARHLDDKVLSAAPGAILARAVRAVFGAEMLGKTEVDERRRVGVRDKDYVSALASVAAVRSALGDVFFGVKRHRAVAAVTRFDKDRRYVQKHLFRSP